MSAQLTPTPAHSATSAPAQRAKPTGPVRTVPWFGAMQAFKRQYERLHPAVQMIGLQLWFPAVFVILFVFCYINAFHSPTPHGMHIGVVGQQAAGQLSGVLDKASPGGFSVSAVTPGSGAEAVRSAQLVAVFDPSTAGGPTLTVASADGSSNVSIVEQVFRASAAATHSTLQINDVAPLPKSDGAGTVALYVSLVSTIGGYMVGMFVGMMGAPLKRRVRLAILVGTYVPLSLLAAALIGPVLGALTGHFFALWMVVLGTMLAVGLVVNGLAYFFNRFVTAAAMLVFVFLNVPSSGGAMAADVLPEPFRWLNHVEIGGGTVPMLRAIFYGVGPGVHVGVWRIACFAAAGLLLLIPGPAYARWRHRRRTLLGLPAGGMMAHAQQQLAAMTIARAQGGAQPDQPQVTDEDASGTAVEAEAVIDDNVDDGADRRHEHGDGRRYAVRVASSPE